MLVKHCSGVGYHGLATRLNERKDEGMNDLIE
jgi:hypothetical protein